MDRHVWNHYLLPTSLVGSKNKVFQSNANCLLVDSTSYIVNKVEQVGGGAVQRETPHLWTGGKNAFQILHGWIRNNLTCISENLGFYQIRKQERTSETSQCSSVFWEKVGWWFSASPLVLQKRSRKICDPPTGGLLDFLFAWLSPTQFLDPLLKWLVNRYLYLT